MIFISLYSREARDQTHAQKSEDQERSQQRSTAQVYHVMNVALKFVQNNFYC